MPSSTSPFGLRATLDVLFPLYAAIEVLARQQVMDQALLDPSDVDEGAQMAAEAELRSRMEWLASDMTRTTYKQLAATLSQGQTAGEGMDELGQRVGHVFTGARNARAPMIAHTEVVGALNGAAHQFALHLPEHLRPATHRWNTLHDGKTRPSHRAASGQEVALHEPFQVGGFPAMYPGDRALPPAQSIGCRCYATYSPARVPDPAMLVTTGGSQ